MTRCLTLTFLLAAVLLGQRNELSLQFGGTVTQRRSIGVPTGLQNLLGAEALREDNGYGGGIVYRVRLVRFGAADLLMEVPLFVVQATNTDLIPLIAQPIFGNTSGASAFLTPGVVLRFLPEGRLSAFVFFGGGYARVVEAKLISAAPVQADFVNEGAWALSFGGGADLRLANWISLRGELRNFYTGLTDSGIALPAETRQRNTLLLTGGLAFRF